MHVGRIFNGAGKGFMGLRKSMAQKFAVEVPALPNNFDLATVRPALDTHDRHCSPCWIVLGDPDRAEVVYEDEPDMVASMRNRPGRFVAPA